jgi:hypothetical protein
MSHPVTISGRFTSRELGDAAALLEQLRQIRRWKRMEGGRRYLKAHYGSGRTEELFLDGEELGRILDMLEDSRVWKLRQMGVTDL